VVQITITDWLITSLIIHEFENDVSCLYPCDHYVEWQTTMVAHFGHKWDKLFRGPMWSYDGESSGDESEQSSISSGIPVTKPLVALTL
jgi:hypothetical protein